MATRSAHRRAIPTSANTRYPSAAKWPATGPARSRSRRGIPAPHRSAEGKGLPPGACRAEALIDASSFARPMGRDFFTLDDFDLAGSTVLLRVDINSPIDPSTGRILNDSRIREHLATVRDLADTRLAILAHQSRPGKDDFTTLEAHAERMSALLGRPVAYVDSLFGRHAVEAIQGMKPGDVVMLENTRFFAEE